VPERRRSYDPPEQKSDRGRRLQEIDRERVAPDLALGRLHRGNDDEHHIEESEQGSSKIPIPTMIRTPATIE